MQNRPVLPHSASVTAKVFAVARSNSLATENSDSTKTCSYIVWVGRAGCGIS